MAEIATEQGHWYQRDGTPAYTITGKNGKERATTLRDARKLSLAPSVTTILQIMAKPGLEMWKINQVLLSALTLPRNEGEDNDQFAARVLHDWQEEGKKARDRGTTIHGALERNLLGLPVDPEYHRHCLAADHHLNFWVNENGGDVSKVAAEKSFACDLGYGGKVDFSCPGFVADFKTTDKPLESAKLWDEHPMQLAAYRYGLGMPEARCAIVYVHVDGSAKLIEVGEEELDRGWAMFLACLNLWSIKSKYKPGF
jgi:hypothetical protein